MVFGRCGSPHSISANARRYPRILLFPSTVKRENQRVGTRTSVIRRTLAASGFRRHFRIGMVVAINYDT